MVSTGPPRWRGLAVCAALIVTVAPVSAGDNCTADPKHLETQCISDYCSADRWISWETSSGSFVCVYILGLLWMFLSLSIVCDEFFVPALEALVRKLDISPDIAGATFMAAGGSAPELFTSFIGTFTGSSVGFGTIVGSAVFNVLFVIGTCAVCSKDVLELTWWPLARDATYYCTSLFMLALCFGVYFNKPSADFVEVTFGKSGEQKAQCFKLADMDDNFRIGANSSILDEQVTYLKTLDQKCADTEGCLDCAAIWWYEALLLFLMYGGYCIVMQYNQVLAAAIDAKAQMLQDKMQQLSDKMDLSSRNLAASSKDSAESMDDATPQPSYTLGDAVVDTRNPMAPQTSMSKPSQPAHRQIQKEQHLQAAINGAHSIKYRSSWRTGLWTTLMHEQSLSEQAELHLISHIPGSVDETFKKVDADKSGTLTGDEMKKVLQQLRVEAGGSAESVTSDHVHTMFKEISSKVQTWDKSRPNEVSMAEFHEWYQLSEQRINDQVTHLFHTMDADGSNHLDRREIQRLLHECKGKDPTEQEVQDLWEEMMDAEAKLD
eukprot:COSAG01_NODE_7073_length_3366_cov_10.407407_2_plen_547_part_01